jgi:hypothetical protein
MRKSLRNWKKQKFSPESWRRKKKSFVSVKKKRKSYGCFSEKLCATQKSSSSVVRSDGIGDRIHVPDRLLSACTLRVLVPVSRPVFWLTRLVRNSGGLAVALAVREAGVEVKKGKV